MKIICECKKIIEHYDDFFLNGEKIWKCECGRMYIADEFDKEDKEW